MKRLVAVFTLALLLTLPMAVAYASPPQPASGAFAVESVIPTSVQPRGGNCIIEAEVAFSFTGDLAGAFTSLPLRIVHRGPCGQPAPETFHGHGTFSGAVGAASGAFDFNFRGSADAQGSAQAKITVLQGTGGLADLRGSIRLTGQTGVGGTYSGAVHLDP